MPNITLTRLTEDGRMAGGPVLEIDETPRHNKPELLFVYPRAHNRGIGYAAWQELSTCIRIQKYGKPLRPALRKETDSSASTDAAFASPGFLNSRHPDPETGEKTSTGMKTLTECSSLKSR